MERREIPPGIAAAGVALIAAGAFGLRFYHIGGPSFWRDEVFSALYAGFDGRFLWGRGFAMESNPPLYYSLLHVVIGLFGRSETALRLPSAVASALTCWPVYLLGLRFGGRGAGLAAAALFALAPMDLYYGQEARSYALMTLADAVLLLGAARMLGPAPGWRDALLYGVASVATIYLHATGIFLVAVTGATVAVWLARADRAALAKWVAANAAVAVLALPELAMLRLQAASPNLNWISRFDHWSLIAVVNRVLVDDSLFSPLLALAVSAALLALLAGSLLVRRQRAVALLVTVAIPVVWVVLMSLVSLARPTLIPRIAIWSLVPYCVLCAVVLVDRRRNPLRLPLGAVLAVAYGLGLATQARVYPREDWRGLVADIGSGGGTIRVLAFTPNNTPLPVDYYRPALQRGRDVIVTDQTLPQTAEIGVAGMLGAVSAMPAADFAALADGGHAWLVTTADSAVWRDILARCHTPPRFRRDYNGGLLLLGW